MIFTFLVVLLVYLLVYFTLIDFVLIGLFGFVFGLLFSFRGGWVLVGLSLACVLLFCNCSTLIVVVHV